MLALLDPAAPGHPLPPVGLAPGDLLAVSVADADGRRWLLASFHGDSGGRSCGPVLSAIAAVAAGRLDGHLLLVGLDANTGDAAAAASPAAAHPGAAPSDGAPLPGPAASCLDQGGAAEAGAPQDDAAAPGSELHGTGPQSLSVGGLSRLLAARGLVSLWGAAPAAATTACSGRTLLQAQPRKAARYEDRAAPARRAVRDWIVSRGAQTAAVEGVRRDNTGRGRWAEGAPIPSPEFPSDHAVISARFCLRPAGATAEPGPEAADASSPHGSSPRDSDGSPPAPPDAGESTERGADAFRCNCPAAGGGWAPAGTRISDEGPDEREGCLATAGDWEPGVERICEELFLRCATGSGGGELDSARERMAAAAGGGGSGRAPGAAGMLLCARPVSTALRGRWARATLLLAAALLAAAGALNTAAASSGPLEALRVRVSVQPCGVNGTAAALCSALSELILLKGGCAVAQRANVTASAGAIAFVYAAPVSFDGFRLIATLLPPLAESSQADPSVDPWLLLETSDSYGGPFEQKQWPAWLRPRGAAVGPASRAMEAGATDIVLDLRPPTGWVLQFCAGVLLQALGCCAVLWLSFAGRVRQAAEVASVFHLALAAVILAAAVTEAVDATRLVMAATLVLMGGIVWHESWAIALYGPVGLIRVVAMAWSIGILPEGGEGLGSSGSNLSLERAGQLIPWLLAAVHVTICLFVCVAHIIARCWLYSMYSEQDRRSYEAVWHSVKRDVDLPRFCCLVNSLALRTERSLICRQYFAPHKDEEPEGMGLPSKQPSLSRFGDPPRWAVQSLDQLYVQATVVDLVLHRLVQHYANTYAGQLIPSKTEWERSFWGVAGSTSLETQGQTCKFGWRWSERLKPIDRALDKLMQSYGGDVSRLLDCCRSRIAFSSIGEMFNCLEAIAADKEIKIVRLKNMLDQDYDTSQTAGFRYYSF